MLSTGNAAAFHRDSAHMLVVAILLSVSYGLISVSVVRRHDTVILHELCAMEQLLNYESHGLFKHTEKRIAGGHPVNGIQKHT